MDSSIGFQNIDHRDQYLYSWERAKHTVDFLQLLDFLMGIQKVNSKDPWSSQSTWI